MASVVARLVASIGADTKGLQKGLDRANQKLKGFAKGGSAGLAKVGGAASKLGMIAGVALPASIAAGAGAAVVSIGKMGIAYNSLKEQAEIAFTTMLGSGREAREMLADLETFAAKTPFEFEKLLPQSQQLKAFGFEAKRIIPMLTTIGDAVSGLGGGADKINRVTLALGQMQAKGKVSAQELMQLTEAGIPAWQYLADTLNTDVAGAMKLVEQRSVDAGEAISGILAGMDTDFGGMMAKQAQTLEGAWSTIKDTGKQIAGMITEPVFDALRDEMTHFANVTLPEWLKLIKGAKAEAPKSMSDVDAEVFALQWGRDPSGFERAAMLLERQIHGASFFEHFSEQWKADAAELERMIESEQELIAELGKDAGGEFSPYDESRIALAEQRIDDYTGELEELRKKLGGVELAAIDAKIALMGVVPTIDPLSGRYIGEVPEPEPYVPGKSMDPLEGWGAGGYIGPTVGPAIAAAGAIAAKENEKIADQYGKDLQRAIEDAHRKAKSRVEGILFTPSQVTKEDMFRSTPAGAELFGKYEDKPDEYVRRLEAAAQDANSEWRKLLIPEDVLAAGEDAIRIYVDRQKGLFSKGMLPEKVDWDAFAKEFQGQAAEEASKAALVERGMSELAKRGITVDRADVEAMVKPGAGAAKTMTDEFKKGLQDQSPVTLLLDQINTEMTAKAEDIKKSGTVFFETFLGGIDDTKETTVSWLLQILLPGLVSELEYQGYVGGENP